MKQCPNACLTLKIFKILHQTFFVDPLMVTNFTLKCFIEIHFYTHETSHCPLLNPKQFKQNRSSLKSTVSRKGKLQRTKNPSYSSTFKDTHSSGSDFLSNGNSNEAPTFSPFGGIFQSQIDFRRDSEGSAMNARGVLLRFSPFI